MKKLVTRTLFVLTLLLALGAVLGGAYSIPAQAATLAKTTSPQIAPAAHIVPKPIKPIGPVTNITVPNCAGRTDFFKVYYNWGSSSACFANNGSMNVYMPGANEVCTGNNTGSVTWLDETYYEWYGVYFPSKWTCYWINGSSNSYVPVYNVTIN
ncbi:hypothetical protein ccbrp13_16950 [Ktedonobacteria bacterium brp13]|nr:hypothetical protein ccbrp13_16950 [Ktedonobacteria bacterium brp13]